ncbi:MAG: hypothetical protein E7557_07985 [Ruminococcaceae bacterium]|nr:hypothetical protein [Oscillospiraceae bacterium]
MLKGINKQVLEIIETNNGYFEKALFFVKPEFSGYSESKLRELAQAEIKFALQPPKQRARAGKTKLKNALSLLLVFISGIASGLLISFII